MADVASNQMGNPIYPPDTARHPRASTESTTHGGGGGTEEAGSNSLPAKPKCMFTENCDTGTSPRKAISHFFGRNKACTLKIPMHVWVHYCRKHYQRIRYRNSKDYSLIQIDLVKTQVKMLQEWSRLNQESGEGLYIKDWVLSLRKREQQRLEVQGTGQSPEGTSSVPQWLRSSLGDGYSTEEILAIVERVKLELADKTLEEIPEIEFLPDIVGTDKTQLEKTPKTRRSNKRKLSESEAPQPSTLGAINPTRGLASGSPEAPFTPRKYRRYGQMTPEVSGDDYTSGGFDVHGDSPGYFTTQPPNLTSGITSHTRHGYGRPTTANTDRISTPAPGSPNDWSSQSDYTRQRNSYARPAQPISHHSAYAQTDQSPSGPGSSLPPMRDLHPVHSTLTRSPDQAGLPPRRPQMADRSYTEPSFSSNSDARNALCVQQTPSHTLNPVQEPATPGRYYTLATSDASASGPSDYGRHLYQPPGRSQVQGLHSLPPPHSLAQRNRDGLGIKVPGPDERPQGLIPSPFPSYFSATGALQSPLHGPHTQRPSPQLRHGNDARSIALSGPPITSREYEARESRQ